VVSTKASRPSARDTRISVGAVLCSLVAAEVGARGGVERPGRRTIVGEGTGGGAPAGT
jgi:hypothetical protein